MNESVPLSCYVPGTIVWVHLLHRVWWPGKVINESEVPVELKNFMTKKKKIIAIVFFSGDNS